MEYIKNTFLFIVNNPIIVILLLIIILAIFGFFYFFIKKEDDKRFKNRIFFLLGFLSLIGISIFSTFGIFLINNGKIIIQDYSLILTKGILKEIELKDKPTFYLSGEILSGTTFSGIVYELQGNNFIKQSNSGTGLDLSNYITKSDIKDFYMDSYNKRIEGMQNQINVFLSIITLIGTLLLFLGYKSVNILEEKTSEKLTKYFEKGSDGKTILDKEIVEYIKGQTGTEKINEIIKGYIEGQTGTEKINEIIKGYIEGQTGTEKINEIVNIEAGKIAQEQISKQDFSQKVIEGILNNDDALILQIKSKFVDDDQKSLNEEFYSRIRELESKNN